MVQALPGLELAMSRGLCLLTLVLGATAAAADTPAADPSAAPASAPMSAAECAVWARERSFAASVQAHDAAAFVEHLHPDAVFIDGRGADIRGRAAVAADWQAIIEGKDFVLRWYPERVSIGGDQHVALSRGPYWIAPPAPDKPFLIGHFISTWVQGADGQWRVLYDGGGGNQPKPATAQEVEALQAGLPAQCPAASAG